MRIGDPVTRFDDALLRRRRLEATRGIGLGFLLGALAWGLAAALVGVLFARAFELEPRPEPAALEQPWTRATAPDGTRHAAPADRAPARGDAENREGDVRPPPVARPFTSRR
jgi:hypothetical protein